MNAREGRKQRQTAREQRPYNGEEREVRVRIEESELAASCSAGPEVEEQQVAAALGGGAVGAAAAYLVTFFKPEIHVQEGKGKRARSFSSERTLCCRFYAVSCWMLEFEFGSVMIWLEPRESSLLQ